MAKAVMIHEVMVSGAKPPKVATPVDLNISIQKKEKEESVDIFIIEMTGKQN
jgi:hypothetical protein